MLVAYNHINIACIYSLVTCTHIFGDVCTSMATPVIWLCCYNCNLLTLCTVTCKSLAAFLQSSYHLICAMPACLGYQIHDCTYTYVFHNFVGLL